MLNSRIHWSFPFIPRLKSVFEGSVSSSSSSSSSSSTAGGAEGPRRTRSDMGPSGGGGGGGGGGEGGDLDGGGGQIRRVRRHDWVHNSASNRWELYYRAIAIVYSLFHAPSV